MLYGTERLRQSDRALEDPCIARSGPEAVAYLDCPYQVASGKFKGFEKGVSEETIHSRFLGSIYVDSTAYACRAGAVFVPFLARDYQLGIGLFHA
jgi:hypothetical protein